jgi:hypothetical protein
MVVPQGTKSREADMNGFIRGEFEGTRQPWRDDPASELVEELEAEFSDELELTQAPRHRNGTIGRLVDEDGGGLDDTTREALARDTGEDDHLSAEESALHYADESELSDEDPDLTPGVLQELEGF